MTKKKKILIIVSCVLLATVLIYSAAWYVNYIKYDKWEKKLGYCVKHMKYVLKETKYNEATGEFETTGYEVMLDGNKNLMTNEEHLLEIYKENYDELEKIYDKANELWGIFE